ISSSLVKGWLVSLFAPSVLILTIGQGRIGCKSETRTEEGEIYGAGKNRTVCIFIFMQRA
ncbi:hypothetical protein LIQ05_19175, partial [Blautia glucerasea]|uniref:hypothetical protein n=1 Tax=Blautia glucerasea TaxID=536633 RepID=UPI001D0109F6